MANCWCRYDEGIDVLYGTNTFHLSSERLLTNLSNYILPHRLAQMSSFEIVLPLAVSMDHAPLKPENAILLPLLSILAQSSGARQLYLCLPCQLLRHSAREDVDIAHIIDALDEFVLASGTESIVLQMNPAALTRLAASACVIEEEDSQPTQKVYTHELWRCLDGDAEQAKTEKRRCFYPQVMTPLKDAAVPELGRSRGYWIMSFLEESPYIVCGMP